MNKNNEKKCQLDSISIVGADANNLNIERINFDKNRVTMVTGVSGAGKSSLLTGTLAREAARRMNLFLGIRQPHLTNSEVRAFINQTPATIHIGQRAFRASIRTTVGTATGLLSVLKRLFISCSQPFTPSGELVPQPSAACYAEWIFENLQGKKLDIYAIPIDFVATDAVSEVGKLKKQGISSVVVRSETDSPKIWEKGRTINLNKFKSLSSKSRHIIEVLISKIEPTTYNFTLIKDELERAFDIANSGSVCVVIDGEYQGLRTNFGYQLRSSLHWVKPGHPDVYRAPSPHLLSFNSPDHELSGACPACLGTGRCVDINEKKLIINTDLSMHNGAFALWNSTGYKYVNIQSSTIEGLRGIEGFSPDVPWKELSSSAKSIIINGYKNDIIDLEIDTRRKLSSPHIFEGFRSAILRRVSQGSKHSQVLLQFVHDTVCLACGGTRWSNAARALKVAGVGIDKFLSLPFVELENVLNFNDFSKVKGGEKLKPLIQLVCDFAKNFISVGLGHLSADRGMLTLSEGETRRLRLAAVLHAKNEGLCLLMDEPARSLHDEDVYQLAGAIRSLAHSHTVIMNEHRQALACAAHRIIEIGPAGPGGGRILRDESQIGDQSLVQDFWRTPQVLKRNYISSNLSKMIEIRGSINNIKNVQCRIPLNSLTCITGVSGSGKSSFLRGIFIPALLEKMGKKAELDDFDLRLGGTSEVSGYEKIQGLLALSQKTPPTNRRSIVATFIGVAEIIREIFSADPVSKNLKIKTADFGLNAGNGRCEKCLGLGEMEDQSNNAIPCSHCGGLRFCEQILSIKIDNLSMNDLLNISIEDFNNNFKSSIVYFHIQNKIKYICSLGMGYLSLGRRLDTLSGGEIQRLRIARKLAEPKMTQNLLFVLDEPAAGLHHDDVMCLMKALDLVLEQGNTVVLVEHNPAIIESADWLVEFGPGGGPNGGYIVAEGAPLQVQNLDTATGRLLASRKNLPVLSLPPPTQTFGDSVFIDSSEALRNEAKRSVRWIRQLLGDDIVPSADLNEDLPPCSPTVMISDFLWKDRRFHEIYAIDQEIVKFFLDIQKHNTNSYRNIFLSEWMQKKDAKIVIHPCLREIEVWGKYLPRFASVQVIESMKKLSLEMIDDSGSLRKGIVDDWSKIRVFGTRFIPSTDSDFNQCLEDALALGSGFVELRDSSWKVLNFFTTRLIDLNLGLVGPSASSPLYFSRFNKLGYCLACRGQGVVLEFDERLVIGEKNNECIENLNLLHSSAAAILKGVWRLQFIPFLRRIQQEGLLKEGEQFNTLSNDQRNMFLFGYWCRPSYGSFLKDRKVDPNEVGSWLRWDGLYSALDEQLSRSPDSAWVANIQKSRKNRECPQCEGSGLLPFARLLQIGSHSLYEWFKPSKNYLRNYFFNELLHTNVLTERQQRMHNRILKCLDPISSSRKPLATPVEQEMAVKLAKIIVSEFTTMQSVIL